MKLKYKKIILMVSLGTMCIGCVTLSVSKTKSKSASNVKVVSSQDVNILDDTFESAKYDSSKGEMVLEKNKYPEVNQLVEDYYKAQLACDMKSLKDLVTDIKLENEEELKQQSEVIEGYKNFECYTVKGKVEGSFFVFVYNEVKLTGVNTLAPGLNGLYLVPNKEGKLQVFNGVMDAETKKLSDEVNQLEGVQKLISATNTRYLEAMQSDHELYEFYQEAEQKDKE